MRFYRRILAIVLVAGCLGCGLLRADVHLPRILSDHMVLQREQPLRIWGSADAGERVTRRWINAPDTALAVHYRRSSRNPLHKPRRPSIPYSLLSIEDPPRRTPFFPSIRKSLGGTAEDFAEAEHLPARPAQEQDERHPQPSEGKAMRVFRPQHAAHYRRGQEAQGENQAVGYLEGDAVHGDISEGHVLADRPDQGGHAHQGGTGADAMSKRHATHAMQQRHGDDPAPDPQQSRAETGDGTHETTGVPADIVILLGVIILFVHQLHDVHVDHVQQKCPEEPLQHQAIDLVAQLHPDEDEQDAEGEDIADGIPADGLRAMMLNDRRHRDEDVHDHGRGLREMLVMAEDQCQDRDHDDRSADAQQPAHSSGDETYDN